MNLFGTIGTAGTSFLQFGQLVLGGFDSSKVVLSGGGTIGEVHQIRT